MAQLAAAGIIGPALFTLVVLVLGAIQPEYHGWLHVISTISLGPTGWLQDVNFVMFGMMMGVFTIALYRGVRPGPASLTGLAASMLSALGIILMGVFPLTRDRVGVIIQTDNHAVASVVAYVGGAVGLIALAKLLAADASWKRLANFTHKCGLTMALMFPALLAAMPVNSPVHLGVGVLQRGALAVWFTCTIVLALRLRKVLQQREIDEENDRDLVLSR
ncbi:MAG TPA: DUF998 domain-containing protein [Vicinamibacterales bacterium]|nr:DUF998 domain-containing protein [Vicinamibacterales bacterium]